MVVISLTSMIDKKFKYIFCPICGKKKFSVRYNADFRLKDLTPEIFLSRKNPKKIHYRMVVCHGCGILYSNPILKAKYIERLYIEAGVPKNNDLSNASYVYYFYLKKTLGGLSRSSSILDIGCGNGFLLSRLKRLGYKNIYGVEPSRESVVKREANLKKNNIKVGLYKRGLYKKNFFDLITFFQVYDHLVDPNKFLRDCYYNLKPGGVVFALMHNTDSMSLKILGESSPIIDVQHIHLFNKNNVKRIFEKNGFKNVRTITTLSCYSLGYWIKMGPFPGFIKKLFSEGKFSVISNIKIWFPAGNMAVVARK